MSEPIKTVDESDPLDGQALCRACGLCCRGVWYSHVTLDIGEEERAREVGLPLETVDGQTLFHQPCVLHQNNGCSAYETWRPRLCVEYTCAVLDKYLARTMSYEVALDHVKGARAMAERLQADAHPSGGLQGKAFLSRLAEDAKSQTADDVRPLTPAAKLDAVVLRVYYQKHFRKNKKE